MRAPDAFTSDYESSVGRSADSYVGRFGDPASGQFFLGAFDDSGALLWLAGRTAAAPHRLLIYGAGTAGAQTAAGLVSARSYHLLAFADDDTSKAGRSINGVRVYAPEALPATVQRLGITDVLLALPSVPRQRRQQIIESLRPLPVRIRTLPGLTPGRYVGVAPAE
eukprot:gene40694-50351_t